MTAFRLTFDRRGHPVLEEDTGGRHPDESNSSEFVWCWPEDAAEWNELLRATGIGMERAA